MKKLYSAPIADLIETEMDNVLAGISFNVIIDPDDPDDPPGPGFDDVGEAKGSVFDAGSKSNGIFEFDE